MNMYDTLRGKIGIVVQIEEERYGYMKKKLLTGAVTLLIAAFAMTYVVSGADKLSNGFKEIESVRIDSASETGVLLDNSSFPKKLDLRERGIVTPVKFQNPFGTCWAFGALAASEMSILTDMGRTYDETGLDLSEKHLSWFAANGIDDPFSSQYGEGFQYFEDISSGARLNLGGGYFYGAGLFSQGVGPVYESDCPYMGRDGLIQKKLDEDGTLYDFCYAYKDDWSVDNSERMKSRFRMREGILLPNIMIGDKSYDMTALQAVKEQLLSGRGVSISFRADTSKPDEEGNQTYTNTANWCQYVDEVKNPNHGVCVVGYDDSYPATNFNKRHRPPHNGAFLVKNSWGSGEVEFPNRGAGDWGIVKDGVHTGYFWLSYYDKSIRDMMTFRFDIDEDYDCEKTVIDQYDFAGYNSVNAFETKKKCSMANVFKAEYDQVLTEVSTVTSRPDTKVLYEVYLADDAEDCDSLEPVSKTEAEYRYAGSHLEPLDVPVGLKAGQRYVICVTETNAEGKDEVTVPILGYNRDSSVEYGNYVYINTVINAGESYIRYDGKWYDWKDVSDAFNPDSGDGVDADNLSIKGYSVIEDKTDISGMDAVLSDDSYVYSGKKCVPKVCVAGFREGRDFSVEYCNNVRVGTACLTVKGAGKCTGCIEKKFVILPEGTSLKKVSGKKEAFRASWKAVKGVSGYRLSFSRYSDFRDAKSVKVKGAGTVSKTVKGLKSGKKYYVRAAAYKVVNGRTYRSSWSKVKTVSVK